ncbi:MAG TPA: hypothetical protein VGJ09_04095, partial [Bryobacteraceae bacterium]
MKFAVPSLVIVTAAVLAAQETPVVREGAYWVGRVGDSFAIGPDARLQVITRGTVVVKRGSGDQVTYQVRQSVRAASEDKARALLGGGTKQVTRLRGKTILEVLPISAPNVKTDLEITVPPQVSALIVQTELGGIDVAEFDGALQL